MSIRIVSSKQNGHYWSVQLLDVKTGATFDAYWHESEYKLQCFEEKVLGVTVTQQLLDDYRDLINDVEEHNRQMGESD